jgi:hypothetical protein
MLKSYEKHSLWFGGTYAFVVQLVNFIKYKCYLCVGLVYCVLIYLCLIWFNSYMLLHIIN